MEFQPYVDFISIALCFFVVVYIKFYSLSLLLYFFYKFLQCQHLNLVYFRLHMKLGHMFNFVHIFCIGRRNIICRALSEVKMQCIKCRVEKTTITVYSTQNSEIFKLWRHQFPLFTQKKKKQIKRQIICCKNASFK